MHLSFSIGRFVYLTALSYMLFSCMAEQIDSIEKGYSAEDIRKIYGGNLLRVMRAVERAAAA